MLLCVMLVLTCAPSTAFAAGKGDNGYNTTLYSSHKIDGNDLFVYVTGSGGTVERISGSDGDSVQQYKAVASDNWEFAYWSTYYNGPSTQNSNPTAALGYYYFSKPGDEDTPYTRTNSVIQVNEEMWAAGTFYLQAIFKPKVTVSVNRELPSSMQSIRGISPATGLDNVFISGKTGYVPFGATVEVSLSAFRQDYVVESVTVHDGAPRADFSYRIDTATNQLIVSFTATRPTNVQINVGFKEQVVLFDANGGSGSMTAQSFDSGVAKSLSANTFTKTGYTFNGWNTLANGSGTAYTDKQEVTFSPANDGDSITLYAQWKCNHNLKRTEPVLMNDSVGNNWLEMAETCEQECGHKATAKLTLSGETFTYTGQAITPATITYSDNWLGEKDLQVFYADNFNVGTALAGFSAGGALSFTIKKATAPNITFPTVENAITYGQKLKDAKLSCYSNEYGSFNWAAPESVPESSGNYALNFYPNEQAVKNYDWAGLNGTNGMQWIADRNALRFAPMVVVNKADGTGTVAINGWTYGETPNAPVPTSATNGVNNVTYFYKEKGADDSVYTSTVPTQAGEYTLKAVFAGTDHYVESTATVDFEIAKATYDMSAAKWNYTNAFIYNGEEHKVEVTGLPKGVTVSGYTDNTATNVGKYTAKVSFSYDSDNYNAPVIDNLNWEIENKQHNIVVEKESLTGGCVSADKTTAKKDAVVRVTAAANEGYLLQEITVSDKNGTVYGRITEESGTFIMPDCDVTVAAVFYAKEYTITFVDENGVYKTLTVEHGQTVTMPEPPTKDGYTVKWETAIDKATADATIKAIYTETSAGPQPDSPQTGDNSNLWLWGGLLLMCGGFLTTTTLYKRKRKADTKK